MRGWEALVGDTLEMRMKNKQRRITPIAGKRLLQMKNLLCKYSIVIWNYDECGVVTVTTNFNYEREKKFSFVSLCFLPGELERKDLSSYDSQNIQWVFENHALRRSLRTIWIYIGSYSVSWGQLFWNYSRTPHDMHTFMQLREGPKKKSLQQAVSRST